MFVSVLFFSTATTDSFVPTIPPPSIIENTVIEHKCKKCNNFIIFKCFMYENKGKTMKKVYRSMFYMTCSCAVGILKNNLYEKITDNS